MRPKTTLLEKAFLVTLGTIFCLFLIETGLRISGWTLCALRECRNFISLSHTGTYRILCLGESTTANGGEHSYPAQLETILNKSNIGIKFSVINKGVWATTTDAIAAQLNGNLDRYSPDMVITMMGINDAGFRPPQHNPREVKSRLPIFIHSLRCVKLFDYLKTGMEDYFKKAAKGSKGALAAKNLVVKKRSGAGYLAAGHRYRHEGEFKKAEESYKLAIESNPRNDTAYVNLGWLYDYLKRPAEAEVMFQKALEVNPSSACSYIGLGHVCSAKGEIAAAESMFRKSVEISPSEYNCIELADFYYYRGDPEKALAALELSKTNSRSDISYGYLGQLCLGQGKSELAEKYLNAANNIRNSGYYALTYANYRSIANKVLRRGISLVCVQYPMRSIAPLKKMLEGLNGITFVDNERAFEDAVSCSRYDEYFNDHYGGDFGHATPRGNRLLAKDIASAIAQKVFKLEALRVEQGKRDAQ